MTPAEQPTAGPQLTDAQRRIGALLQRGLLARGMDRARVRDAALAYREHVLDNPIPRPTLAASRLTIWRYLKRHARPWELDRVRALLASSGKPNPSRADLLAALDPDATEGSNDDGQTVDE